MLKKKIIKILVVMLITAFYFTAMVSLAACDSVDEVPEVYPKAYSCQSDAHVKTENGKLYYVDDEGNHKTGIYALYENNAYYFNKGDETGLRLDTQYVTENIISLYIAHGCIFIVQGEDRALVIDTGFGFGDVSQLVELFIGDKPYDVALSHVHPDHVGGVCSFEGKADVWTTAADNAIKETFWSVETRANDVVTDSTVYVVEDLYPITETFSFRLFESGHVFSLGNYDVEVIETPGHSVGSVAFLFRQDRLLFTGDNANKAVLMNFGESCATVETWLNSLKSLNERNAEWDAVLTSHNAGKPETKQLLDRLIEVGEKVLADYPENESEGKIVTVKSSDSSCSLQLYTGTVWNS